MITKIFKITAIVLLLAGYFSSISSCGVEKKAEENPTIENAIGMVRDFGSPAVDGCGWVIEVDDAIYAPVRWALDEEFCQEGLKISLDFKKLSSVRDCNWWKSPNYPRDNSRIYPEIKIISIKIH